MQSSWTHGSSLKNDDYRLFPSNDDEIFDVMIIKAITFFYVHLLLPIMQTYYSIHMTWKRVLVN
jgi:hypothetical protein